MLVLEKGYVKDNLISRIPLLSQNFFLGDTLQVQSTRWSEPMKGANGRKNQLWTTEGIGGASRINAMLWTRGLPGDYASWSAKGLAEWAWDKVEPYYRKIENATAHPESASRGHNGKLMQYSDLSSTRSCLLFIQDRLLYDKTGIHSFGHLSKFFFHEYLPTHVEACTVELTYCISLEKAAQNLGLGWFKDCNDPQAPSCGFFPLDTAIGPNRERVSAFTAYLNKSVASQRRGRLTVCTGALVTRLELSSQFNVVSGVYCRSSQKGLGALPIEYYVKARREVIICSGAINTPQTLILSGVGPRNACESIGVPLVKELPAVCATLSDHYAIPIMLELPRKETLRFLESLWGLWHIILWLFSGTGVMGTSSATSAIFLQTKRIDKRTMKIHNINSGEGNDVVRNDVPDIEIMIIPLNTLERDVPGRSLFSLYPTLVQPRGSGRVELIDGDPSSNPRITHPMFLDEQDVAVARLAVRFTMRLAQEFQRSGYPHPAPLAFAPGNRLDFLAEWEISGQPTGVTGDTSGTSKATSPAGTAQTALPEGKTWITVTDKEIDDYMRRVTHTALHFSCTCPMSNSEESGVVDQQLRVFGFKNLRIADASILPTIPSAHTMAPVMMVAERCADFVKDS